MRRTAARERRAVPVSGSQGLRAGVHPYGTAGAGRIRGRVQRRAAYSSSGPGAGGHAAAFVTSDHRLTDSPGTLLSGYLVSLDPTDYR